MKFECIKAAPLGWLIEGETYKLKKVGDKYYVLGEGMVISEEQKEEMFSPVPIM